MRNKAVFILFSLFFIITLSSNSQTNIENVVKVDSASQQSLYHRGVNWVATIFKESKEILVLSDSTQGVIKLKPSFNYKSNIAYGRETTSSYIPYTIDLYLKDGRYKYIIANFIHKDFGLISDQTENPITSKSRAEQKWSNKVWKDLQEEVKKHVINIESALRLAMNKKSESEKDW